MTLHILHLTFDMGIGGTEQVIANLIEHTDPLRFQISVFCLESPVGPIGQRLQDLDAPKVHMEAAQRSPKLDLDLIKRIRKFIKEKSVDVIHCHQYTPFVYGRLASFGIKASVLLTEHGRLHPDIPSRKRKLLNPLLCAGNVGITAISKATRQALIDIENMPAHKIDVVYNGIKDASLEHYDVDQLRSSLGIGKDTLVFSTVARLDPIKNQALMLRALANIIHKPAMSSGTDIPDIALVIVGDGSERQTLEALAGELNITDHVIFTGFKTEPQIYFALMDVFLLSSFTEGTSMTLLEAMAFAKPSVVTDVGGNTEIVHHFQHGLVCQDNNVEQFTKAMLKLAQNPALQERFGRAAQERFSNIFTVHAMSKDYMARYERLAKTNTHDDKSSPA